MAKGLEVARDFFQEWGLPYLQTQYPHLVDRVAAFMCGSSQSLRNDDELSKDHGWGPMFSLVLTASDMRHRGRELAEQINQAAPRTWNGYTINAKNNVDVNSVSGWFKSYLGLSQPPKTIRQWMIRVSEDTLYMLRHSTVFHDPLGEFSARRQAFWYYPEDWWMQRVIHEIFNVWHFGQYNFLDRLARRKDPVAIAVCLGRYAEGVMRLSLLLARDYTPYWKWLAAEFRKLPDVEGLDIALRHISVTQDIDLQAERVRAINQELHSRLVTQLGVNPHPTDHPHPLFCARNELAARASAK